MTDLRFASIGAAAAGAISHLLRSILFQGQPADLQIFLAVGALLSLAALTASWLPAWRASRVDPVVTLRSE